MFIRDQYTELKHNLAEPRRFIQVLTGPRQVGKTTLAKQIMNALEIPCVYASADGLISQDYMWIESQWMHARTLLKNSSDPAALLVLDEIQKVTYWSEIVKKLWDEDSLQALPLKVLILGSSALLIQQGLSESLAGRFETMHLPHWSFPEMEKCFNFTLDQYLYFGGYPGAAPIIGKEERWRNYIIDSLIETSISRDILMMKRVDKPALLRRMFHLGCEYSGQIISYQKMLGQLHDAGNTTTLSHYLKLLARAGMLTGLSKFSTRSFKQRSSSPKLQVFNTGLMSALSSETFSKAKQDSERWGRWVESAIGAHLLNSSMGTRMQVFYWRDRNREVDFVIQIGEAVIALEVKSGSRNMAFPGLEKFNSRFSPVKSLLIGGSGIPIREFLSIPPENWFE